MVFLILESLGSTELVFILIMALVFFGPRKLPQLSRSLGKNLADFRRASEDFKRTWDREVSLEESGGATATAHTLEVAESNSGSPGQTWEAPTIAAVAPDQVVARQALSTETIDSSKQAGSPSDQAAEIQHSAKSDWL